MRQKLKKYTRILNIHLQVSLMYRAELIMWAVVNAFPMLGMILLWSSIYRDNQGVTGFSLQSLITYYLIGYLIGRFISTNVELDFIDEIRTGSISKYILKPFTVPKMMLMQELGWRVLNFAIVIVPIILLITIFGRNFLILPTLSGLLLVVVFITCSFTINVLISVLITAVAFFIDQGKTIVHSKWMLGGIFSGSLLPLTLYPDWLEKIARILPFQFQFSLPLEAYLSQLDGKGIIISITKAIIWIAVLWCANHLAWRKAINKFTAVGN